MPPPVVFCWTDTVNLLLDADSVIIDRRGFVRHRPRTETFVTNDQKYAPVYTAGFYNGGQPVATVVDIGGVVLITVDCHCRPDPLRLDKAAAVQLYKALSDYVAAGAK